VIFCDSAGGSGEFLSLELLFVRNAWILAQDCPLWDRRFAGSSEWLLAATHGGWLGVPLPIRPFITCPLSKNLLKLGPGNLSMVTNNPMAAELGHSGFEIFLSQLMYILVAHKTQRR